MDLYRMGFWQVIVSGGPLMWPILLCSVLASAIVLEKFLYFRSIKVDIRALLENLLDKMKHHQVKEALQVCDQTHSPIANILKAGILKYDRSRAQIKEAMEDASLYEIPKLERNISALGTIAHIAPLLGFLGTVAGMAICFQALQAKSSALEVISPVDLSKGIWQSLLTTVAGLAVAIPSFAAYNYLVSRISGFILEMERASTELINFLSEV